MVSFSECLHVLLLRSEPLLLRSVYLDASEALRVASSSKNLHVPLLNPKPVHTMPAICL